VHDAQQLHHAARIGCDFVVLGPVLPTPSHPGAPALGWRGFERLALHAPLPVYAIGGLAPQDLERAQQSGAHGVALLSLAWGAR
jgi:8-oxo-dGTP diphosphatase